MSNPTEACEACLNLRSKEMYYEDDPEVSERDRRETARLYGHFDDRAYWCQCTQTGRGPDQQPVDRRACSVPERRCYVSIESIV